MMSDTSGGESWSAEQCALADAAFLTDFAVWGAFRLVGPNKLLLDAYAKADTDASRKDLAAALTLAHLDALDSFAALCEGIRRRGQGPAVRAMLHCGLQQAREFFRMVRGAAGASLLQILKLDDVDLSRRRLPAVVQGDLQGFCDKRRQALGDVAAVAAQSLLFQAVEPGNSRHLVLSSAGKVAEIKTGLPSDISGEKSSAFLLVDLSSGLASRRPDLLAVVAPTVHGVLRDIALEIEVMASEAALIAAFVGELAASGALYGVEPRPSKTDG